MQSEGSDADEKQILRFAQNDRKDVQNDRKVAQNDRETYEIIK